MSKRKRLTLEVKSNIIEMLESGVKQAAVAEKLGLAHSTVSTIWMKRNKIKDACKSCNQIQSKKSLRTTNFADVDEALLTWYKQQRSLNVPISGPILQIKAEEFGKLLHLDFKCSPSWIERFKRRHNICFSRICGETASVNKDTTENWIKAEWPKFLKKYKDDDIFNGDETGLFYKMTPSSTSKFKGMKCKGGKMAKQRVTVFVCANLSGKEKRELLVIGQSQNPRCFKHVKKLPVRYAANRKAWMTPILFEEEMRLWNDELKKSKRKIVLLLANCSSHIRLDNLSNIELAFFPANTMRVLQPMEQGVIRSIKCQYRKCMTLKLLAESKGGKVNYDSISILDALRFIKTAWDNVSISTIKNSFRRSKFIRPDVEEDDCDEEDDIPLNEWMHLHSVSHQFERFLQFEEDLITHQIESEEDIVREIQLRNDPASKHLKEEEEDEQVQVPTISDSIEYARKLISIFETFDGDSNDCVLKNLGAIERILQVKLIKSKKRTVTTDKFDSEESFETDSDEEIIIPDLKQEQVEKEEFKDYNDTHRRDYCAIYGEDVGN